MRRLLECGGFEPLVRDAVQALVIDKSISGWWVLARVPKEGKAAAAAAAAAAEAASQNQRLDSFVFSHILFACCRPYKVQAMHSQRLAYAARASIRIAHCAHQIHAECSLRHIGSTSPA